MEAALSRELLIVGLAAVIAFGGAASEVLSASPAQPVWAIRAWLWLSRRSSVARLRSYAESRGKFSRREQFIAAFFAWFFIVFVTTIVFFGCGKAGCE